jgi:hypothetical protein
VSAEVPSRELRNDTADLVPHLTVQKPRGLTLEDVLRIREITAGDPTFAADIEWIKGGTTDELGPIY